MRAGGRGRNGGEYDDRLQGKVRGVQLGLEEGRSMNRAFISHSAYNSSGVVGTIDRKLRDETLKMEVFLSTELPNGVDFVEEIIENLAQTDVLFFVIDAESHHSKWMEWEHKFCKNRDMAIVYIKFPSVKWDNPSLQYINRQSLRIDYDGKDDVLCDKIQRTVDALRADRVRPDQRITPVEISLDSAILHGEPGNPVTISGSIHGNNQSYGSAYLHVPTGDPKDPPTSTKPSTFQIDEDDHFRCEIKMPSDPASTSCHTCYAEIRVGGAARIVQIRVKVQGDSSSQMPSSPGGGGPAEDGTAQTPDKMRQYSEVTLAAIQGDIDGQEFSRPETREALSLLSQVDRIVLTGDKGSGKTVTLCQLYRELACKRRALLVRCDDLLHSESVDDLDKILGGDITVSGCLAPVPNAPKIVLLFDSLDVVSRDARAMSLFRKFLQKLWAAGNVQTVCSVREYDYEYSPLINTVEWGHRVHIGDLPESALEGVLRRCDNPTVPDDLKKILRNPLRLKIFHMIASRNPKANFAHIKTETQLYREHWKEYVDRQKNPGAVSRALLRVAQHMLTSRRVAIPRQDLMNLHEDIEDSYSRDILVISGENVRFFHHAYLDYVASKYILQDHPDIAGFLDADQHNVFLLPTLAFTLSLMHDGSKSAYLKAVVSICNSGLQYYWKTAAIKSLAALDGFTVDEIDPIGRMLSDDADLARHFLLEASRVANPFWFYMWSETRIKEWFRRPHNAKALLEYIASLSDRIDLHEKMANLVRMIVDNDNVHPIARQRAVMSTAGMSFTSKAAWCIELSQNPEAYVRSGVLHCIRSLLDTDEDSASSVFANVASYRETSRETTPSISHGSLNITSNKMQDNLLAVWEACRMFPGLLEKKPTTMIRAAIRTLELINAPLLDDAGIVEDRSGAWMSGQTLPAYAEMIRSIEGALPDLLAKNTQEFAGLLASSRLAMFHRLLLDALLKQTEQFKDLIYDELLTPHILALPSIREPAQRAMRSISSLLSEKQIESLLGRIMELGAGGSRAPGRPGTGVASALRPYYLSAFDRSYLSAEQLELADRWPPPNRPRGTAVDTLQAVPVGARASDGARGAPMTPERAVELLLGNERIGRAGALEVLEGVVKQAGDDSAELDDDQAARMRSLFVDLAGSQDPRENEPDDGRGAPVVVYPSARRLAVQGLIRLCARTGDKSLLPAIESLSRDKINTVRGGVAEDFARLYSADAALARATAARYSRDEDRQVLAYMPNAIFLLARSHPDDAVSAIQNVLSIPGAAECMPEPISHALLYLALAKDIPQARDLLQKVLKDTSLPTEIRRCIPFTLKEGYLFKPDSQGGSLEVFAKLLDSSEPVVRESAAFFLLASAGDDGPDSATALIRKIGPHLDSIAGETGASPPNPRIIEALVSFLKKHWHRMPEHALAILEKISRMPSAPYQPVFAEGTIATLNGLFRTLPGDGDQGRCLTILDVYVKAGWFDAMELLSKMGRPD